MTPQINQPQQNILYYPHQPSLPPYSLHLSHTGDNRRQTPPKGNQFNATISGPAAAAAAAAPRPPLSRPRLSSADSATSGIPRPQRMQRQHTPPQEQPPPPPPPLPSHQYHIRTDSSGSLSSLGSTGSRGPGFSLTDRLSVDIQDSFSQSIRYVEAEAEYPNRDPAKHSSSLDRRTTTDSPNDQHRRRDSGGDVFSLFMWPSSAQPRPVTVEEFHQRNQEFLQRSEHERDRAKFHQQRSPQQQMRRPVPSSAGTPPNSRGKNRPGLSSIDNDNWEEQGAAYIGRSRKQQHASTRDAESQGLTHVSRPSPQQPHHSDISNGDASSSSLLSSSESDTTVQDERTSLLPPAGIRTAEYRGFRYTDEPEEPHGRRRPSGHLIERDTAMRLDQRPTQIPTTNRTPSAEPKKTKKSRKHRRRARRHAPDGASDESPSDSSSADYRHWSKKRAKMLERERSQLIEQWRAEARAEAQRARMEAEYNRWYMRLGRSLEARFKTFLYTAMQFFTRLEMFICNLPLTIGAIALAIVTLGVVWFKFAEENMDSCQPVHFHRSVLCLNCQRLLLTTSFTFVLLPCLLHSSQCEFPEFPGMFRNCCHHLFTLHPSPYAFTGRLFLLRQECAHVQNCTPFSLCLLVTCWCTRDGLCS